MLPTGPQELISSFLATKLHVEIWQRRLPDVIPKTCVVKTFRERSGYIQSGDRTQARCFPDLALTTDEIFQAGCAI